MERIKQALEKAKLESTFNGSAPRGEVRQPSSGEGADKNKAYPEEIGEPDYRFTKVVPLRADLMERNRIVAYSKTSGMAWAFDLLRTQVLEKMEEKGWRTLAITSPTAEAGKTVIAVNLAMSIAHHTTKTALLVDFDLRRPKVGDYLGIEMKSSLNELLAGEAEMQDALVNPNLPRFVVLPTKRPVANPTEVLSSPRVGSLIAELRQRYRSRIVIFDLPPLLSTDDAIAVLPKIDCVLLVVGNGMNTKREIEDSMHYLHDKNLIGTVLNKAEVEPRAYY